QVELVKAYGLGDGDAGTVHVRQRLHQQALLPTVEGHVERVGMEPRPAGRAGRQPLGEAIDDGKADVVPRAGVLASGIAQPDDQLHSLPSAARSRSPMISGSPSTASGAIASSTSSLTTSTAQSTASGSDSSTRPSGSGTSP